jgi:1-acyl-sn-glycerol-3-phosphate acyltransferase
VSLSQAFVVTFFKGLTSLMCRIDDRQLAKVPEQGPLIIYTNHINLLEIPILYTRLQPRHVHGMVLAKRWEIPVLGWALDVTETIPLHREEADFSAIRAGMQVLKRGEILVIAPEGTRSHDGKLQKAHPGVVLLALHSGAPLLPVAYYGAERYIQNLLRLTRSDFHLRVGRPFHLDIGGEKVTHSIREKMVEEMMYQLAGLMPPEYHGQYADQSRATERYLHFGL